MMTEWQRKYRNNINGRSRYVDMLELARINARGNTRLARELLVCARLYRIVGCLQPLP